MNLYFDQIMEPLLIQSYATLFFISLTLCVVIILASSANFSRRSELDMAAVQSAHTGAVPRVGGLAVYIGIIALVPVISVGFIPLSVVFDLNIRDLSLLILSTIPVFCAGLLKI